MVKESRTSSGQYLSPQKPDRPPLANINATMQSNSPQNPQKASGEAPLKPRPEPEFGKASPLRNPLKKPEPNLFIPRKPASKTTPPSRPYSTQAAPARVAGLPGAPAAPPDPRSFYLPGQQPPAGPRGPMAPPPEQRSFYLPGQQPPAARTQYPSALAAAQAYSAQPYSRSFSPDVVEIPRPTNPTLPTLYPRTQPPVSALGTNTFYQPYAAPKPPVSRAKISDDDDEFDPDAAIRAESGKFGEPDPYLYVDASQANENIKNLLEGAFDDEDDKSKVRLRTRAKKALKDGDERKAKSLADKLSALDVKDKETKETETKAEEDEEEEEDGTVEGLSVKLLPHQVEGVAWMIDKEVGLRKKNGVLPHGGILADDMGLGKTVQSIALILTNPRPGLGAKPEHPKQKLPSKEVSKCTLVVAPLALIKQWEDEIKTKVSKSHALRVLIHHGSSRTKSAAELKKYDVVITTYQTLTSEHAGSNMARADGARIGCFGVHWYRIILDEAHSIKNRQAKSTQAACALNGWYRWCLTGTPMQNNLDELQSLIKFLRIKPYCELPNWKDAIIQPMKNGRGGLAMKRLQIFLTAFMKRRTKDILKKEGALTFGGKAAKEGETEKKGGMQIVKREVLTVECDFDDEEQQFYTRLENRADQRLADMTKDGKNDYIGALVLLLRLRQACNHPHLIEMAMSKDKDALTTGTASGLGSQTPRKTGKIDDGEIDALTALMGGISVETKQCDVCRIKLTPEESKDGAVRCTECETDLKVLKTGTKKKDKSKKHRQNKADGQNKAHARNRKVVHDSDDDDDNEEGEGEWIAKGPEQRIRLGKAGGSDDEDAEGGGETLDSIDSERSEDDEEDVEDSPSRARRMRQSSNPTTDEDEEEPSDEDDQDDDDDSESDVPVVRGLKPSGRTRDKPSTKIRRLLRILHLESPKHKTIVFSQFTSMLDLIEPHLKDAKFRFVRYDGSMRPDAREASLHALRTDPKCRVLLCSLKCGSLGLNLTAASRVVIIEPFWNPFVEEQAIDRVHRLNQTVDVKVYRLTMRRSVEEKILDLQERKRELAEAAIEGGKAVGKLSMQDILSLFKHDAVNTEHHPEDQEYWEKFGSDARLLDGPSAGFSQIGDIMAREKPGKKQLFREHDVFGRKW